MYNNNINKFGFDNTVPLFTFALFSDNHKIYCVDLFRQPIDISAFKSKIILHVDFNKTVTIPTDIIEGTM